MMYEIRYFLSQGNLPMNKITFVLLTTISIIFTTVLNGCSDREAASKSADTKIAQKAGKTATPAHIEPDDHDINTQMDHDDPEHGHETGGHVNTSTHEEQE